MKKIYDEEDNISIDSSESEISQIISPINISPKINKNISTHRLNITNENEKSEKSSIKNNQNQECLESIRIPFLDSYIYNIDEYYNDCSNRTSKVSKLSKLSKKSNYLMLKDLEDKWNQIENDRKNKSMENKLKSTVDLELYNNNKVKQQKKSKKKENNYHQILNKARNNYLSKQEKFDEFEEFIKTKTEELRKYKKIEKNHSIESSMKGKENVDVTCTNYLNNQSYYTYHTNINSINNNTNLVNELNNKKVNQSTPFNQPTFLKSNYTYPSPFILNSNGFSNSNQNDDYNDLDNLVCESGTTINNAENAMKCEMTIAPSKKLISKIQNTLAIITQPTHSLKEKILIPYKNKDKDFTIKNLGKNFNTIFNKLNAKNKIVDKSLQINMKTNKYEKDGINIVNELNTYRCERTHEIQENEEVKLKNKIEMKTNSKIKQMIEENTILIKKLFKNDDENFSSLENKNNNMDPFNHYNRYFIDNSIKCSNKKEKKIFYGNELKNFNRNSNL